MTILPAFLALTALNTQTLSAHNDFEFGVDSISVYAEVVSMPKSKSSYTFKQGQIYYKGDKVWKWRQDDSIPITKMASVTLDVNGKIIELSTQMIEGIIDIHLFEKTIIRSGRKPSPLKQTFLMCSGSASGRNWRLFIPCSDAGGGFGILFSGTLGSKSIERQVFIESKMVEKKVFLASDAVTCRVNQRHLT